MKPGIYEYVDPAEYHADCAAPSLSASIAHVLISRSPKHAWFAHPRLNPDFEPRDDPKFDLGKAVHQLLLEGNENIVVVPANDWRTKAAQETREVARADRMTALLEKDYENALAMRDAIADQLAKIDIEPFVPFTAGRPEVTLVWHEGDVVCRARLDWLHDGNGQISDLKTTTRSARGEDWTRGPLYDHGCDLQAAFYRRGVQALTGVLPEWRWVVVESSPPFALQVVRPGADVLALGEAKVERALALWAECLESDVWPAYSAGVFEAEVPGFVEMRWLEREAREAA